MAFLTLNGTEYEVLVTEAEEDEPEPIGEQFRAFDGTLRSTIRAEARVWHFGFKFYTQTEYATLRTLIKNGAEITLGGDCVGGADVLVAARMSASYLSNAGIDFYRLPKITLTEVIPT